MIASPRIPPGLKYLLVPFGVVCVWLLCTPLARAQTTVTAAGAGTSGVNAEYKYRLVGDLDAGWYASSKTCDVGFEGDGSDFLIRKETGVWQILRVESGSSVVYYEHTADTEFPPDEGWTAVEGVESGPSLSGGVSEKPSISPVANQFVNTYQTLGPLDFTIDDEETAASNLALSKTSDDTGVVPTSGITFGGSGANRTVTVDPAEANTGTVTVTVTVDDGALSTSETFDVEVVPRALTVNGTGGADQTDAGWRFIGVPTSADEEAGDLRIGGTAPSFTLPSGHMLQEWDDTQSGTPTGGYDPIESGTETLTPGRGYALYLFDKGSYPIDASTTIDVAADPALTGDQTVTISGLAQSARWHLLGNPYPTGYDLSSLTDLSANGFSDNVQRYDAQAGTWDVTSQSSVDLSAWQGFFIERSSTGSGVQSVSFDPAGRIASAPFVKSRPTDPSRTQRARLALSLTVVSPEGDTLSHDRAAQVVFDERATKGWDAFDASKLTPLAAEYALLAPDGSGRDDRPTGKAVESRPWPSDRQEIPLRLTRTGLEDVQEARLSVEGWALPDGWRARIADTETGRKHFLDPGASAEVVLPADSIRETPRYELQVAPTGAPLPVELAAFEAAEDEEAVRLTWQTASETNNAAFRIQRRAVVEASRRDASTTPTWKTIDRIEGASTTEEAQTYRFRDADLPFAADTLSYRLQQVDTDGTTHPSEVVTVARSAVQKVRLHGSFPNPARTRPTIRYALPKATEVSIKVYDLMGRRVRTLTNGRQAAGRKEFQLDVSQLASGTYFYRLTAGGTTKTRKLTIVR